VGNKYMKNKIELPWNIKYIFTINLIALLINITIFGIINYGFNGNPYQYGKAISGSFLGLISNLLVLIKIFSRNFSFMRISNGFSVLSSLRSIGGLNAIAIFPILRLFYYSSFLVSLFINYKKLRSKYNKG
jgi:hypothetical protein